MKSKTKIKNLARTKRKYRIRKKISGTAARPRLVVFRSNKNIYAQLIDDVNSVTLASASSLNIKKEDNEDKKAIANKVGLLIGTNAKKQNISKVVFDRAGYMYHGRVKALADGARKNGLEF